MPVLPPLRAPIRLRQYESRTVDLSDAELRAFAREVDGKISVAPSEEPGRWILTAGSHIGTLVVANRPILVRPKIPLENVFTLLEVGIPDGAWRTELFGYDQAADLLPSVVSWFARLVETTLGRGLLRSYQQQEERLISMRGRVDVSGLFRQPGLALPVPCRFDEFTADILENQYLRATIRKVILVPGIPAADQRRLRRELARLEDVSDLSMSPEDFGRISFDRLNQHYQPALRLAKMLLENLTLIDQAGDIAAASFLVDMNVIFEKFVASRLKGLLWERLDVDVQTSAHLGEGKRVLMKPDLEFSRGNRTVYVGDTKYKVTDNAEGRSSDYYQMLAYTTALDLDEGVLIYCRDVGSEAEGAVTVQHAGKRLMTYALDLHGSADDIAVEMEALADWIARQASTAGKRVCEGS